MAKFENKQTRPIRVIVKNLHPTYNVEEIKKDLAEKGFQFNDVNNKLRKSKRNAQNATILQTLFMLTFQANLIQKI